MSIHIQDENFMIVFFLLTAINNSKKIRKKPKLRIDINE